MRFFWRVAYRLEYELIRLLHQRLLLLRAVLASLALALHPATAGPRHGSSQVLNTLTQ